MSRTLAGPLHLNRTDHLDVKDTNGRMNNWKVEMGSPDALTREGWTRTSVKTGDEVTVEGWRARSDGSAPIGRVDADAGA